MDFKKIKTSELLEIYVFYNARKKHLTKKGLKVLNEIEKELENRNEEIKNV
jgi:hypothetical protein